MTGVLCDPWWRRTEWFTMVLPWNATEHVHETFRWLGIRYEKQSCVQVVSCWPTIRTTHWWSIFTTGAMVCLSSRGWTFQGLLQILKYLEHAVLFWNHVIENSHWWNHGIANLIAFRKTSLGTQQYPHQIVFFRNHVEWMYQLYLSLELLCHGEFVMRKSCHIENCIDFRKPHYWHTTMHPNTLFSSEMLSWRI